MGPAPSSRDPLGMGVGMDRAIMWLDWPTSVAFAWSTLWTWPSRGSAALIEVLLSISATIVARE